MADNTVTTEVAQVTTGVRTRDTKQVYFSKVKIHKLNAEGVRLVKKELDLKYYEFSSTAQLGDHVKKVLKRRMIKGRRRAPLLKQLLCECYLFSF